MRTRTADALVGALVLGAVIVTLVAVVVTRGWTERRVTIFMLSPTVQDLKVDTPVYLRGLAIGEIKSISPQVDSGMMGAPRFLIALRLRERFANGRPIQLSRGTTGRITSGVFIGAASISLEIPDPPSTHALVPGDTIEAIPAQGWAEGLKEVVDTLKTQVSDILQEARTLLRTVDRTAATAGAEVAATGPELRATLASTRQVLDRLDPLIAEARTAVVSTDQRLGTLQDSLTLLLSDTRRLLNHADTLTTTVTGVTADIAPDLKRTLTNVYVLTTKIEHFMDQVTRRPHRLVTGVRGISRDSILQNAP